MVWATIKNDCATMSASEMHFVVGSFSDPLVSVCQSELMGERII